MGEMNIWFNIDFFILMIFFLGVLLFSFLFGFEFLNWFDVFSNINFEIRLGLVVVVFKIVYLFILYRDKLVVRLENLLELEMILNNFKE